jgi:hypothetical protein
LAVPWELLLLAPDLGRLVTRTAKKKTTTPFFFLVEKCAKFPFCSKVEATYGLETVITVIDSPSYVDQMDGLLSSLSEFFLAYLPPCALQRPPSGQIGTASQR